MEIYNVEKTQFVEAYDLDKGYLKEDTIVVHHEAKPFIERKSHYVTVREYPNGSKDVEEVIDIEGQEASPEYDEEKHILVFVPYSFEELQKKEYEKENQELHEYLDSTDWCVIKSLEIGSPLASIYPDVARRRSEARARINVLEGLLS